MVNDQAILTTMSYRLAGLPTGARLKAMREALRNATCQRTMAGSCTGFGRNIIAAGRRIVRPLNVHHHAV